MNVKYRSIRRSETRFEQTVTPDPKTYNTLLDS
jgi:hypothetical protein